MSIRLAVIGTSWITEEFLNAAEFAGGFELCGVCSRPGSDGKPTQKALDLARKFGINTVYDSCESLAEDNSVDAVYIASPNSLHFAQSKTMLESGKHVICEKPAAVSDEEIMRLVSIATEKRLVYMEAIMFLYMPELVMLKDAMKKIGHISSANLDFSQLSSRYAALKRGELPNIYNPEFRAGCLMDIGVYNIYTALELFGAPRSIISSSSFISTGADGCGSAVFDYPDKTVTLTYSKIGQSYAPSQIFGDKGTILIDSISQLRNIEIHYSDGTVEDVCGEASRTQVMSYEATAFRDFINGCDNSNLRLSHAHELSKSVCSVMSEIRSQNKGFKF